MDPAEDVAEFEEMPAMAGASHQLGGPKFS